VFGQRSTQSTEQTRRRPVECDETAGAWDQLPK
jgi:hypothetical protein